MSVYSNLYHIKCRFPEAVTHILETESESQTRIEKISENPKVIITPGDDDLRKEQELRRAAETVSEQFAQLWTQDAEREAVQIQQQSAPATVEELAPEQELEQQKTEVAEQASEVPEAIQELVPEPEQPVQKTEVQEPEEQKQSPPRTSSPMNYEDKVKTIESNLFRVSSQEQLEPIEATNMLLNTALQLKVQSLSCNHVKGFF